MAQARNISSVERIGIIGFETIFPEETKLTPREYLHGCSRSMIMNVAVKLLGFRVLQNSELLTFAFSVENAAMRSLFEDKIRIYESGLEIPSSIINQHSGLKFFQEAFQIETEEASHSATEVEVRVMKAYLSINSATLANEEQSLKTNEFASHEVKFAAYEFCQSYYTNDLFNQNIYDVITAQLIKAHYLFSYLESDPEMQGLLQEYLVYFECTTWQEYIKRFFPLLKNIIEQGEEFTFDLVVPSEDETLYKNVCGFIDKICIEPDSSFSDYDFNVIRSSPIYKVGEGQYRYIFNLFIVEKLFKNLYFILSAVNNRSATPVRELKSKIGEKFSERKLLYGILNEIYSNRPNYIRKSGEEILHLNIDAEPDYYMRIGKNIFLFESKDFLIKAIVKESRDYNLYVSEFKNALYSNQQGSPKAILQLKKNVSRVLKREFTFDTGYNYREVNIYPIIVTHDFQYNTRGLNKILNSWFGQEMNVLRNEGLFTYKVKPLLILDIDTLILFIENLKNGEVRLNDEIDSYFENVNLPEGRKFANKEEAKIAFERSCVPFSNYIDLKLGQDGTKRMPAIVYELSRALFN